MENVKRTIRRALWGLVWIGAGAYILLANHGLLGDGLSWGRDWPLILVLIGISQLIDAIR